MQTASVRRCSGTNRSPEFKILFFLISDIPVRGIKMISQKQLHGEERRLTAVYFGPRVQSRGVVADLRAAQVLRPHFASTARNDMSQSGAPQSPRPITTAPNQPKWGMGSGSQQGCGQNRADLVWEGAWSWELTAEFLSGRLNQSLISLREYQWDETGVWERVWGTKNLCCK